MKKIVSTNSFEIPDNVELEVKARKVKCTGPRGTLYKDFSHLAIDLFLSESEEGKKTIQVDCHFGKKKQLSSIRTTLSHIRNLVTGVTKGFEYKMRLVYAHFPINVAIMNSGKAVEVRNFLGEKRVRYVSMMPEVSCERSEGVKDELKISGNDIEMVGRSCGTLSQSCAVLHKDIRKFLDGIYVSERGTVIKD